MKGQICVTFITLFVERVDNQLNVVHLYDACHRSRTSKEELVFTIVGTSPVTIICNHIAQYIYLTQEFTKSAGLFFLAASCSVGLDGERQRLDETLRSGTRNIPVPAFLIIHLQCNKN